MTNKEIIKHILENTDDLIRIDEEAIRELTSKKLSENIIKSQTKKETFAEKLSDKFSTCLGSWKFIIIFLLIIISWVTINVSNLIKPFDPYPFILLNLFLSCFAGFQAPIIMMAQNRQEAKDRERVKNDYKLDLKAEILLEEIYEDILMLVNEKHSHTNLKEEIVKEEIVKEED